VKLLLDQSLTHKIPDTLDLDGLTGSYAENGDTLFVYYPSFVGPLTLATPP